MPSRTRIMFFDTGNYSRSPAAQIIATSLAAKYGRSDEFEFSSAGFTKKHANGPADPRTAEACEEKGYSLEGFVCSQADQSVFQTHDEIWAVDMPTYCALSLARRDGDRAEIKMFDPHADVLDPFFGDQDGFAKTVDQIEKRLDKFLGTERR